MKTNYLRILFSFIFLSLCSLLSDAQKIEIYTMQGCGRCEFSIRYAKEHHLNYVEYSTAKKSNSDKMWKLLQTSPAYVGGSISMPVVVANGKVSFNIDNLEGFMEKFGNGQSTTNEATSGCVSGNCENGFGTFIYKNNDKYVGNFVNKSRSGQGKYTWASGGVYEGQWLNGKQEGFGTYTSNTGAVQTGTWVKNKLQKAAQTNNTNTNSGNSNLSKSQIYEFVDRHNYYRRAVGSVDIVWNDELAKHALQWANHLKQMGCKLEHRPQSGTWSDNYGENIAMNYGKSASYAVDQWGEEKKDYDNKAINQGNYAAWHYTQVIWNESTQVGCAIVKCDNGSNIIVCNYNPAGNMMGQKPFKK